jgi:predicted choloylglycine hydrolase
MPEIEPMWERLVGLTGADPEAARMLSLYRPPPYVIGCSQAVWNRGAPFLVRNYDYHPEAFEGLFLLSNWHGTEVISASDCLWGVVDGMNEHGLAVALSYGGSREIGIGFGIPLILRYVLEFSTTVKEAVEVLSTVPSHMAYNVSLLDRSGAFGIAYVGPGSRTRFVRDPVSTNHQDRIEWKEYVDRTNSSTRKSLLERRLKSKATSRDEFVEGFLDPPLYVREYRAGRGTLYTAAYHPREGRVDFLWPSYRTEQSFTRFVEADIVVPFQPN